MVLGSVRWGRTSYWTLNFIDCILSYFLLFSLLNLLFALFVLLFFCPILNSVQWATTRLVAWLWLKKVKIHVILWGSHALKKWIYIKFGQRKYDANICLLQWKPVANVANAIFGTIFTHQFKYGTKYDICNVFFAANICLHHICAVQIWCKSIFSSSLIN